MTSAVAPPPTYENPIDERLKSFSPVWLNWFLQLAATVNGGGASAVSHNLLGGLQGGGVGEYYHLAAAAYNLLSVVAAGTYIPTLTNVANLAASTSYAGQYFRIGSVVTVSGKVDVDPTAGATSTKLGISLPIASTLAAQENCAGTAFASGIAGQGAAVLADIVNNRAQMQWVSADVSNQSMYYTFAYLVA